MAKWWPNGGCQFLAKGRAGKLARYWRRQSRGDALHLVPQTFAAAGAKAPLEIGRRGTICLVVRCLVSRYIKICQDMSRCTKVLRLFLLASLNSFSLIYLTYPWPGWDTSPSVPCATRRLPRGGLGPLRWRVRGTGAATLPSMSSGFSFAISWC